MAIFPLPYDLAPHPELQSLPQQLRRIPRYIRHIEGPFLGLLLVAGGSAVWLTVNSYLRLFDLPGIDPGSAASPIYMITLGILWAFFLIPLLIIYILPRYEMMFVDQQEHWAIANLRVLSLSVLSCTPAFRHQEFTLALTFAAWSLVNAVVWGRTRAKAGRGPFVLSCAIYWLAQIPAMILFSCWLLFVALAWFGGIGRYLPHGSADQFWQVALVAGLFAWGCHRLIAWRGAVALMFSLGLLITGMWLARPGIAGLVATGFYALNIGGGSADTDASGDGRLLCDLGVLGRHFYIEPGPDGCTQDYANTALAVSRSLDGHERADWIRRNRITPKSR